MTLLLFQVSYCIKIQLAGSIGFDKRKPEISVQKLNRVNMVIAKIHVSVTVEMLKNLIQVWLYILSVLPILWNMKTIPWWWFSLFSSPICLMKYWYCKEKLDFSQGMCTYKLSVLESCLHGSCVYCMSCILLK